MAADTRPRRRPPSWLAPVAVGAVVVLVLFALRPGVVENGVRSPRVWLVVAGVVLAGRLVARVVRRATGRALVASLASNAVVVVAGVALLAPTFQQRTLEEPFPAVAQGAAPAPTATVGAVAAAVGTPAATPPGVTVTTPPVAAPPAPPEPEPARARELGAGRLDGVGHSASGRTALYAVGGRTVLRFEGVDIEGTPGPHVHLVRRGARTPQGGVHLGPLKAERGSFSYAVPRGVDPTAAWTVLVWCRPYATPVAAADL